MNNKNLHSCPLCLNNKNELFAQRTFKELGVRNYLLCHQCHLIFADRNQLIAVEDERERYAKHNNDPNDMGYLDFLNQLVIPLSERLTHSSNGIDFGCGPGPAVSVLFKKKGIQCQNYDPAFYPDEALLKKTYDFLISTETIEHVVDLKKTFDQFQSMVDSSQGLIGLMTNVFYSSKMVFDQWWYPKDITHISFFQPATFEWISKEYQWKIILKRDNIVIFEKGNGCV